MNSQIIDKEKLTSFTNAYKDMIATNERSYSMSPWSSNHDVRYVTRRRKYTPEEVENIIDSGSTKAQIKLSRHFFFTNGFYRRIILHYATLLKYVSLLIPNPSFGKSLSEQYIQKKYYNAIDFLDAANLPGLFEHIAVRALRDGCYYGVIQSVDKNSLVVFDLPVRYCSSRFKSKKGNDVIEFDVTYFDSIFDKKAKNAALRAYPKVIANWYRRYKNGNVSTPWVTIPGDTGICIPFYDGRPFFTNIIPATMKYDKAVETNQERDLEEIRKIIVQHIPHLTDGGLLFEPDEAKVMHEGAVGMMKGNPNVSVLTTYADVDAIVSKTTNDNTSTSLENSLNNIYSEAGTSKNLFGTDSNLAMEISLQNDLALMMPFARKLENVITNIVNEQYSNSNIRFKYTILPVTYYNESKYVDTTFKLAGSGYSFLLPMLAMGFSQKEIGNIKDLENDVLSLKDKFIPLSSQFQESAESGEGAGRPKKELSETSEKTEANQKSLDKGGSSVE